MEEPITKVEAPKSLNGELKSMYAVPSYSSQSEGKLFADGDEEFKGFLSFSEKQTAVLNEHEQKENTQWNP